MPFPSPLSRGACLFACILLSLSLLAACGGRAARPVAEHTGLDDRLGCDHLQGEHAVNLARLRDFARDQQARQNNNAAFLFATPFSPGMILFLDLTDTEKREAEALIRRNQRLQELSQHAGCPALPDSVPPAG